LNVWGQTLPAIQIDRPDQTECPYIVPTKHFQVENGFSIERTDKTAQQLLLPSTLWKIGVNQNFELRLITELVTIQTSKNNLTGIEPIKVGFKARLFDSKGLIPLTSFMAHLSLPFLATKEFSTPFLAPNFRFTMQHKISNKINFGYNLGAEWDGETPLPSFIYTATIGYELNEKWGCYFEAYGFMAKNTPADHRLDGGFTYLYKQNIIFDLSGGVGLTPNAPLGYIAFGTSFRLPH
jgi:Putative MetA-pathway of phenol degradation